MWDAEGEAKEGREFNLKLDVFHRAIGFFSNFFEENPLNAHFYSGDVQREKLLVLSGHTGISKSSLLKGLEQPTEDNLVEVFIKGIGGEKKRFHLPPKVITFRVGLVTYDSLMAFDSLRTLFYKQDGQTYGSPIYSKLYMASDRFRSIYRDVLSRLILNGTLEIEETGTITRLKYKGVFVDEPKALNHEDEEIRTIATIIDNAKPAVLFLDGLNRNIGSVVSELIKLALNKEFNGESFLSTYFIGAWNDVPLEEYGALGGLYLTFRHLSGQGPDRAPDTFPMMESITVKMVCPSEPHVYSSLIDYLSNEYENNRGRGNLLGVREFLERLAVSKFVFEREQHGKKVEIRYNLLYVPPLIFALRDPSDEEGRTEALMSGFITFRSHERLLEYLSRKKELGKDDINFGFIRTLYGPLFSTELLSGEGIEVIEDHIYVPDWIGEDFAKTFRKLAVALVTSVRELVAVNFGKEALSSPTKRGISDIVRESLFAGTPTILWGPPGVAKTQRARKVVDEENRKFFERIETDRNFYLSVKEFVEEELKVGHFRSPKELVSFLRESLELFIGTLDSMSPQIISGAEYPIPERDHQCNRILDQLERFGITRDELDREYFTTGRKRLVTAPSEMTAASILHRLLAKYKDLVGVVVFHHISRFSPNAQWAIIDALSERTIGGVLFDEDTYERIRILGTANFTSKVLYGTFVSPVDAALIARFANVFRPDLTEDEIREFFDYLVDYRLTDFFEGIEIKQNLLEEVRSYLYGKVKFFKEIVNVWERRDQVKQIIQKVREELENTNMRGSSPLPLSLRTFDNTFFGKILELASPIFFTQTEDDLRSLILVGAELDKVVMTSLENKRSPFYKLLSEGTPETIFRKILDFLFSGSIIHGLSYVYIPTDLGSENKAFRAHMEALRQGFLKKRKEFEPKKKLEGYKNIRLVPLQATSLVRERGIYEKKVDWEKYDRKEVLDLNKAILFYNLYSEVKEGLYTKNVGFLFPPNSAEEKGYYLVNEGSSVFAGAIVFPGYPDDTKQTSPERQAREFRFFLVGLLHRLSKILAEVFLSSAPPLDGGR